MKFACVSDMHGHLPEVPKCDAVLIGGDIGPGHRQHVHEAIWYDKIFRKWLEEVGKPVFAVAGNHDWIFQKNPGLVPDLPWTYLQDSGCEFGGFKFYGSPHQPLFFNWAFNATEDELKRRWDMIPDDTDILLLHGPPYGYGDLAPGHVRTGSPSLTKRILQLQPKVAVFGHIHGSYGQYHIGETLAVNAALLNEKYQPTNMIQVVEL